MKFVTTASAVALAAAGLIAWTGAASAQQTLPRPASPPLAEAPVDPEQLAVAKRLIALMSTQMNFGEVWKTMTNQMLRIARSQSPNADPAAMARLQAAMDKAEAEVMPQLLDEVAALYARHLTRKEMEDSIAFYETPSGQAILHKMPEITADMGPVVARIVPRMRDAMLRALCANIACTPEQQKAIGSQSSS